MTLTVLSGVGCLALLVIGAVFCARLVENELRKHEDAFGWDA